MLSYLLLSFCWLLGMSAKELSAKTKMNIQMLRMNDEPLVISQASINQKYTFRVFGWQASSAYQIVLSYPGFLPVKFDVTITYPKTAEIGDDKGHHRTRFLLDTEVRNVKVPSDVNILSHQMLVQVDILPLNDEVFSQFEKNRAKSGWTTNFEFALEIHTLYMGVIPAHTLPVVLAILVVLLISTNNLSKSKNLNTNKQFVAIFLFVRVPVSLMKQMLRALIVVISNNLYCDQGNFKIFHYYFIKRNTLIFKLAQIKRVLVLIFHNVGEILGNNNIF
ncbi:hypothetical protein RFI_27027 [Reticulomyxa filosa]|uniref:Dolichyl-diphosphooligosaccharide--protein glycosyltransferase subunit 1 n=1 Tax=Reticulomyxa filosa TaxID=46433 RepID=X6M8N0_RETFI|nr:hypothetical protein RFI_27027 [Reticulomyxa filosa]|eukprot:ETO10348.1 hypothetical protein RFI_27027 [Reticulomyxa filosa]